MRRFVFAVPMMLLLLLAAAPITALASGFTGAVGFGQVGVEPAYDGRTGQEVFILLPSAKPQPTSAWSPLYLVMYPTSSTIGMLDCSPQNCDHANVLPSGLGNTSVYPDGTVSTPFGNFTGGVVKGHDHLLGVDANGHMHVTKHVFLVWFTTQGASDGAINTEITTIDQLNAAISNGDVAAPMDTGLIIHAAMVSGATYLHAQ